MPKRWRELRHGRRYFATTFTDSCDVSKLTTVPSEGPGEPAERRHVPAYWGVPCNWIVGGSQERPGSGGVVVRTRVPSVAVAHDAPIDENDVVTAVYLVDGSQANERAMTVVGLERYPSYTLLRLQEVTRVV